ncbi:archaea-specific SMC-related protein [Halolamina salifodinae]|uniref:Chromosome segregation ATPase n=1 Tax=Halolamina salifodinae TaxID=1202767 RepID=A0A8T4GWK7_9EURY|nr:archaea-specific SMC-related protein [Halolamina salifodinae]MBP1986840.1 chromosome segregation ATPase [Halolamina salifodinae]
MSSETELRGDPAAALSDRVDSVIDESLEATLHVQNIGGITQCTVPFSPGITILTGENATNRTSLLTALNGVLGGSEATLRSDADSGHIELSFNDTDTFTRTYERDHGQITTSGDPYCEDEDLVDAFCTLLEHNDARDAVERGENLRDVLMRPVDTHAIRRQIREKTSDRDELQSRLRNIDQQVDQEAALSDRKEALQAELEDIESEIEEKRSIVSEYQADMDMAAEAEELVDDVESAREDARDLENQVEVLKAELEAVREEETELKEDATELYHDAVSSGPTDVSNRDDIDPTEIDRDPEHDGESISDLKERVSSLKARKDELTNTIDDLTRIINFNERIVDEAADLPGVTPDDGTESVTAELAPESQTVECWTCGSTVEQNTIQSRTRELQSLVEQKREQVTDITAELGTVQDRLEALQETRRERQRVQSRLEQVRKEQDEIVEEIEETEAALDAKRGEIETLQEEIEATAELRESDLLDAYQELNELEYERGQIAAKIEDVESELADIEDVREERDDIETEIESIREELEDLRTHVADLERNAVDSFNSHMEDILDRLRYENIARVWIERKVSETATRMETGEFELHIVRESEGGVYEDIVDTLSESEREVIGLIVALAGYLVHDIDESVPFLLLDSVEAVDSQRLVELVEYFAEHAVFLNVALLPEDASAFSDAYDRVTADMLTPS